MIAADYGKQRTSRSLQACLMQDRLTATRPRDESARRNAKAVTPGFRVAQHMKDDVLNASLRPPSRMLLMQPWKKHLYLRPQWYADTLGSRTNLCAIPAFLAESPRGD